MLFLALSGCALPRPASVPVVYDFGPGALHEQPGTPPTPMPALELRPVQASTALGSTALLYRLAYADAQQLKPYTLARWSMPPAQLIEQRLRAQLGQHRAVLSPGQVSLARPVRAGASAPALATTQPQTVPDLHLALEEFSQLFASTEKSSGVLRLRATVTQRSAGAQTLLAQRSFTAQVDAPTPDASGAVRALTGAADQVLQEVESWLGQVERLQHRTP